MKIINRHGIQEDVRLDAISDRIRRLCDRVQSDVIDPIKVATKVCSSIRDGIRTSELDELTAQICMNLSLEHPDWAKLGAIVVIDNHRKNVRLTFSEAVTLLYHHNDSKGRHTPLVSDELYNVVKHHSKEIENMICHERDYLFDYFGFKTLERNYLMKKNDRCVETPQYMWMRVSIGIWGNDLERVKNTYDLMSQKYFTHATPTLFNFGTTRQAGTSCFEENTLVDTLSGPKRIVDVEIGDLVLTHAGNVKPVAQIHKNPLDGRKVYTIQVGNATPITVTGNHNIMVYTSNPPQSDYYTPELMYWKAVEDLQIGDLIAIPYYRGRINTDATRLAQEIESRYDTLQTYKRVKFAPLTSKNETTINSDYVYTLGVEDDHSYSIGGIIAQNCFLLGTEDSIEGIYKTITNCAQISKWAGGIGVHVSNIRGKGSFIRKTNGHSDGILPMLKVYNETARYVNQAGKRLGSFAVYIEPWHSDIYSFLDAKRNHGNDYERARDLFYALWVPDLFMERVRDNGVWSLMCPDECPGLPDAYGDEFNRLYTKYENEKRYKKQIKARDLWQQILVTQIETGMPYISYKDHVNRKTNHSNLGTIKSSNLCNEINEYSDDKVVACCNLASISLPTFLRDPIPPLYKIKIYGKETCSSCKIVKSVLNKLNWNYEYIDLSDDNIRKEFYKETNTSTVPQIYVGDYRVGGFEDFLPYIRPDFDFEALRHTVHTIVENLDRIIDINFYPIDESKTSNIDTRPLGIGVQGLADVFARMYTPFDEGHELNKLLFERIYFYAIEKSIDLAKEKGPYPCYEGSPFSNGLFQFNLWGLDDPSEDWAILRARIKEHGIRNSLLTALMPTASTSQILGNTESFEPITSNMYKRSTLAGEFIVINKYLMEMLHQMGLYNEEMKFAIMYHRGSIQNIPKIPKTIKKLFKTAWEISQKTLIDMSADRGPFVDQSQSFNIFTPDPDYHLLTKIHMYGWSKGLKTGSYYIRTKPAMNSQSFTMDPEMEKRIIKQMDNNDGECLMCSS